MRKLTSASAIVLLFATNLPGQTSHAPPPRPQTARQALIELITGGQEAQLKHLTREVQEEMSKPASKAIGAAYLGSFSSMMKGAGNELKSFDSGSILFSLTDTKTKETTEIVVENDDLSGDQDTLQLSLHGYADGKEKQDDNLLTLSPKFSVEMKKQDNVWRLNNISVNVNFPVGSPKLFQAMTQASGGGDFHSIAVGTPMVGQPERPKLEAPNALMMLANAETMHAKVHPETGFTCSLSELVNGNNVYQQFLDPEMAGGTSNGFKFNVSNCQGMPAGSFQITAEPVSPGAGSKAYCVDATGNIRFSEDGRGTTCLTAGKTQQPADEVEGLAGGMYGVSVSTHPPK